MSKLKDFISLVGAVAFAGNQLVSLASAIIDMVANYLNISSSKNEPI